MKSRNGEYMKLLVTGVNGQLGHDIVNECKKRKIEVVGVDIQDMNIVDQEEVKRVLGNGNFDAVIHCAAWTAVDKAEEDKEACFNVNLNGTKNILEVCQKQNIKMMYFSTDYVFDGQGENFWDEYDERYPLNVYGESKYESEKLVEQFEKYFIIRTSWVFGENGNNFIKTMLKLASTNKKISVVNDQIGSPTYTYDMAKLCVDMITSDKYGTYHITNEGLCSWYEFALEIFKQAKIDIEVIPVTSDDFPAKAARPKNSRMSKKQLDINGFKRLPKWEDALQRYLKTLGV